MALTCYPVPGKEKSKVICHAFKAGAPAHATGAVFFGTEGVMDAYQRAKSGTWWYVDNSYFDRCRGTYFRVTKNALQVEPRQRGVHGIDMISPFLKASTGERFAKLGVTVRPAREQLGTKVLVIPQSDDFMKSTLGRKGNWTAETVQRLAEFGVPAASIKVRPWLRDKKRAYIELREDLLEAKLVVTWSSASAITALLEGVPAISESGSAHALTGPLNRPRVERPPMESVEVRQAFANVLADNQWTLDEMRDGTCWKWLERNGDL